MAELIPALYEIIGRPPAGQDLLAAAGVYKPADVGASNAVVFGGALGAGAYAASPAGKRTKAVNEAHKALGLSSYMVWALNAQSLLVFKASSLKYRPKSFSGRVALDDIAFDGLGKGTLRGGALRSSLNLRLHGVQVQVFAPRDEAEAFASTLQDLLPRR